MKEGRDNGGKGRQGDEGGDDDAVLSKSYYSEQQSCTYKLF